MFTKPLLFSIFLSLATLATAQGAPPPMFIAIGGENTGEYGEKGFKESEFGLIHISEDGENWETVFRGGAVSGKFSHSRNNMLRCLAYGDGTFVATGNAENVIVSNDGRNWRVVDAPSGSMSVAYGNNMFFAPGAAYWMRSEDGVNWTRVREPGEYPVWGAGGAGHVRKVVYQNGVFLVMGGKRIGVTDGKKWLFHRILPEAQRPGRGYVILAGNGKFVLFDPKNGNWISEDGIDWDRIDFGELVPENEGIAYSGTFDGEYFVTSIKGKIIRSRDGENWEMVARTAGKPTILAGGNGKLVRRSRSLSVSDDYGRSWQEPVEVNYRRVYYFDGESVHGQSGG